VHGRSSWCAAGDGVGPTCSAATRAVLGPSQELGGGARITTDQPAEEEVVVRHEGTIAAGADDGLMVG